MSSRYLKNGSFFGYQQKKGDSRVWKGILSTREIIRRGSCYRIGNGRLIDACNDPWVPRMGNKAPAFLDGREISGPVNVATFLDGENRC